MQTLVRHASVKRFHPSDQIVHFLNLICWAALAASGIALGSAARAGIRPERLDVSVHFIAGFALIIVIAAWLVFSPARARRFVHEILRTDRPFLAWLRNLGGYPQVPAPHEGRTLDRAARPLQRGPAHRLRAPRAPQPHADRHGRAPLHPAPAS